MRNFSATEHLLEISGGDKVRRLRLRDSEPCTKSCEWAHSFDENDADRESNDEEAGSQKLVCDPGSSTH